MKKKKKFAVLGLGRFGANAAFALEEMGYEVMGVDIDNAITSALSDKLSQVVSFDIRDAKALEQVNISDFDTVIISSKNLEASLMATMLCKEFNIEEIVVKAINERHAEMAKSLGATKIIFSERDMARRTVMHLVSENAIDYIDIDANIKVININAPKAVIGKSLAQSHLRAKYNIVIIVIVSNGVTMVAPSVDYVIKEGDKLFIIGRAEAITKFEGEIAD